MRENLFLVTVKDLTPLVKIELLFPKETKWTENDSCYLKVVINRGQSDEFYEIDKIRFVFEDQMKIEPLIEGTLKLVESLQKKVEAIDVGLNLLNDFYVKFPGISGLNIEIRREVKRQLNSLNEYKIKPVVIDLYSNYLFNYKGSDTLQFRKYKQGIMGLIDAQNYQNNRGGTYGIPM